MNAFLVDILGEKHLAVLRYAASHPEGFVPLTTVDAFACDALVELGALSRYGRNHVKITRAGRIGLGLGENECSICRRTHGIEVIHACE